MMDNKSNLARLALVEAFQRGELSFIQMAKKAKRVNQRERDAAKKQAAKPRLTNKP